MERVGVEPTSTPRLKHPGLQFLYALEILTARHRWEPLHIEGDGRGHPYPRSKRHRLKDDIQSTPNLPSTLKDQYFKNDRDGIFTRKRDEASHNPAWYAGTSPCLFGVKLPGAPGLVHYGKKCIINAQITIIHQSFNASFKNTHLPALRAYIKQYIEGGNSRNVPTIPIKRYTLFQLII